MTCQISVPLKPANPFRFQTSSTVLNLNMFFRDSFAQRAVVELWRSLCGRIIINQHRDPDTERSEGYSKDSLCLDTIVVAKRTTSIWLSSRVTDAIFVLWEPLLLFFERMLWSAPDGAPKYLEDGIQESKSKKTIVYIILVRLYKSLIYRPAHTG
jgi:hypothetical protein